MKFGIDILHDCKFSKNIWILGSFILFWISLLIAIVPEENAIPLVSSNEWSSNKSGLDGRLEAKEILAPYQNSRKSQVDSNEAVVFRTWTHSGNILLDITSKPFSPPKYLSILLTGGRLSLDKKVESYLECISSRNRLYFFRGTVNTNLAQSVFSIPDGWCADKARLVIKTLDANETIGIGSVFEISKISYLKSRFIGLISYYFFSIAVFTIIFIALGLISKLFLVNQFNLLPVIFIIFGIFSLSFFYLSYFLISKGFSIYIPYSVIIIGLIFIVFKNLKKLKELLEELLPYWKVWALCSLFFTSVLLSVNNGVAHWEPNIRFWPAFWSSDNELPWMFAEAVINHWPLDSLFGGWKPTDRPPLMTAAYLLVSPITRLMQSSNDGYYLTGVVYNIQAIILSSLLAPVILYAIKTLKKSHATKKINYEEFFLLILCFATPFIFFNTIYGWPKIYGAAFGVLALATLFINTTGFQSEKQSIPISLGLLVFSFLAHGSTIFFIIPIVSIIFSRAKNLSNIFYIAKCCFCTGLFYLSWSIFKYLVLPSKDPVTKYALTGDFHFSDPDTPLIKLIIERYSSLGLSEWLTIKWLMVCQQFIPIKYQLIEFGLNYEPSMSAFENIRARDFLFLSGANFVLPLLLFLALIVFFLDRLRLNNYKTLQNKNYYAFIGVGLMAWALMILLFLTPAVLHHWPYAAFVVMLIGSAGIIYESYRTIFQFVFTLLIAYTSVNWVLFPILNGLTADYFACFLLGLFYFMPLLFFASKWHKKIQ